MKKTINKQTGEAQVTGQKGSLAKSANYPLQFGLAVAGLVRPTGYPLANPEPGGAVANIYKLILGGYIHLGPLVKLQ